MRTSDDIRRQAERSALAYLEIRGFKILEQNWRRPRHKIDIVAEKNDTIHFIEVKYSSQSEQNGLEVITSSRLTQLQRAAWLYVEDTKWRGNYFLSAIEVGGPNFSVLSFSENVI